jgi:hypothetical protein
MNQIALNETNHDSICAELITRAERELAAFFRAVTESFGKEQAEVSADNWLRELAAVDDLPASPKEWGRLTVRASARLVQELHKDNPYHGTPMAFLKSSAKVENHNTTV